MHVPSSHVTSVFTHVAAAVSLVAVVQGVGVLTSPDDTAVISAEGKDWGEGGEGERGGGEGGGEVGGGGDEGGGGGDDEEGGGGGEGGGEEGGGGDEGGGGEVGRGEGDCWDPVSVSVGDTSSLSSGLFSASLDSKPSSPMGSSLVDTSIPDPTPLTSPTEELLMAVGVVMGTAGGDSERDFP